MLKNPSVFQLIFSVFCASLNASQSPGPQAENQIVWANLATSTSCEVREHFKSVKEEATNRWLAFQAKREFKPFIAGQSDAALQLEFESIQSTREFIWTTLGYDLAQHLVTADLIRAPGCVAFAYNNTVPYYNASTIWLGNKHYIACEGPRSKDIPSFFNLLTTHHVTHLVRLTDSYEGKTKKCHPYWEGVLNTSNGGTHLEIPIETGIYSIRAFDMAHWRDNQGVDPDKLLNLVLQVRKEVAGTENLLLVHCSAGVGRTGTFLAALAIVEAIDQEEPFSIEEIVYRLSLQRVHSVSRFSQYMTLHRLAESYLKQRK